MAEREKDSRCHYLAVGWGQVRGSEFVTIVASGDGRSMSFSLSPATARLFASQLVSHADGIEAQHDQ